MQSSLAADYGTVQLSPKVCLFDSDSGIPYGTTPYPQTFESHHLYSGLMLYQTTLPAGYLGRGYLVADDVHDRAYVYVNQVRTIFKVLNEGPEYIICYVGNVVNEYNFCLVLSSLFSENPIQSLK